MMHNSRIILVIKQRLINSLLDDRVAIWTMTFPTIQGLLLAKWGQCPMSLRVTKTLPNLIDEVYIS
jgi:hypothetical protein